MSNADRAALARKYSDFLRAARPQVRADGTGKITADKSFRYPSLTALLDIAARNLPETGLVAREFDGEHGSCVGLIDLDTGCEMTFSARLPSAIAESDRRGRDAVIVQARQRRLAWYAVFGVSRGHEDEDEGMGRSRPSQSKTQAVAAQFTFGADVKGESQSASVLDGDPAQAQSAALRLVHALALPENEESARTILQSALTAHAVSPSATARVQAGAILAWIEGRSAQEVALDKRMWAVQDRIRHILRDIRGKTDPAYADVLDECAVIWKAHASGEDRESRVQAIEKWIRDTYDG